MNELLTISLRYYDTPTGMIKEVFTGFVSLDDLGAENITRLVAHNVESTMKLQLHILYI